MKTFKLVNLVICILSFAIGMTHISCSGKNGKADSASDDDPSSYFINPRITLPPSYRSEIMRRKDIHDSVTDSCLFFDFRRMTTVGRPVGDYCVYYSKSGDNIVVRLNYNLNDSVLITRRDGFWISQRSYRKDLLLPDADYVSPSVPFELTRISFNDSLLVLIRKLGAYDVSSTSYVQPVLATDSFCYRPPYTIEIKDFDINKMNIAEFKSTILGAMHLDEIENDYKFRIRYETYPQLGINNGRYLYQYVYKNGFPNYVVERNTPDPPLFMFGSFYVWPLGPNRNLNEFLGDQYNFF